MIIDPNFNMGCSLNYLQVKKLIILDISDPGIIHEICMADTFQANCPEYSVISINYAMYGRMGPGKCISSGQSDMGCKTDVSIAMNTLCSGKSECAIEKVVSELYEYNPCQVGVPHLKTSFNCIEGKYTCELHQSVSII